MAHTDTIRDTEPPGTLSSGAVDVVGVSGRVSVVARARPAVGSLLLLVVLTACGTQSRDAAAPPGGPPSPTTTTTAPAPAPGPSDAGGQSARWRPAQGTTWQYQLSGTLDLSVPAEVYDVDWEETSASQVGQLHESGRRAICYVNAGAYEEWRPDAAAFPDDVLGAPLDGWPGERWLDIRRTDVLLPIIAARMEVCRAKGFDAVEPDNVDGYSNASGFPLVARDQLAYNTAIARLAHERGLSVGLKNDVDQVADLEPHFDFVVNEECLAYDECGSYGPFLRAGKAVLNVEYDPPSARECALARSSGVSPIVKDLDLGQGLRTC